MWEEFFLRQISFCTYNTKEFYITKSASLTDAKPDQDGRNAFT